MSVEREPQRDRPVGIVTYDFSQGSIAENLTPLAVEAMRALGVGTNRMEAELRNYLRYRGVDEVRPIRVLQIVNRYVRVRPKSFTEMEHKLGREAAREHWEDIPRICWLVQDFLDYLDPRLGHAHRMELNWLIEDGAWRHPAHARQVSTRHLLATGFGLPDVIRHMRSQRKRAPKAVVRT